MATLHSRSLKDQVGFILSFLNCGQLQCGAGDRLLRKHSLYTAFMLVNQPVGLVFNPARHHLGAGRIERTLTSREEQLRCWWGTIACGPFLVMTTVSSLYMRIRF